ncbi:hypothetical protein KW508_00050 [Vibrio fluvialis]|nr:hypothetical protein [Vibrio fluvialis]
MRTAINTCLTLLLLLSVFLSAYSHASDESSCPLGISTGNQTWDGRIYGDAPYLCLGSAGNCQYRLDYTSVCSNVSYECDGTFVSTGDVCTESEGSNGDVMWPGGDLLEEPDPDPDPDPSSPLSNYFKATCTNGVCTGTVETNSATRAFLETSYNWAQFMRQEGYSALMDELTLSLPKKIVQSQNSVEDKITVEFEKMQREIDADDAKTLSEFSEVKNLVQNSTTGLHQHLGTLEGDVIRETWSAAQSVKQNNSELTQSVLDQFNYNAENFWKSGYYSEDTNQRLGSLETNVSGIADGLEALSAQISGASGTDIDLSGVESKLQGIQETLDGKGLVGRPFEGQVDFEGNGLYGSDAIEKLEGEIEQLQEQYQEQMGQFKSLFTFDESQLNAGEYVKHEWTFTFANGRTNSFSSGVFPALLQNANFIAAVLLFLAVLLGIKALTD